MFLPLLNLLTFPYAVKEKFSISRIHYGFYIKLWIWALAGSSYWKNRVLDN